MVLPCPTFQTVLIVASVTRRRETTSGRGLVRPIQVRADTTTCSFARRRRPAATPARRSPPGGGATGSPESRAPKPRDTRPRRAQVAAGDHDRRRGGLDVRPPAAVAAVAASPSSSLSPPPTARPDVVALTPAMAAGRSSPLHEAQAEPVGRRPGPVPPTPPAGRGAWR
ncbi:hypothetical protein THAOC_24048, partial [Thalassiosira oceanica]